MMFLRMQTQWTTTMAGYMGLRYDVLLEDGSGNREYYLEGVIFVSQGYTAP